MKVGFQEFHGDGLSPFSIAQPDKIEAPGIATYLHEIVI